MEQELTDRSNDLRLQPKLTLEASGKVADAALSIPSNVRNLADVIKHVATSEY